MSGFAVDMVGIVEGLVVGMGVVGSDVVGKIVGDTEGKYVGEVVAG